ncbi:hypothetical protein CRUP_024431, partial [Coryphaenoides rupestris]
MEQPSRAPASRAFLMIWNMLGGGLLRSKFSAMPPVKSSKPSVVEPPDRASSSEWNYVEGECPNANAEDGEFWMSFNEFLRHYSRIEICTLTPDTILDDSVKHWS